MAPCQPAAVNDEVPKENRRRVHAGEYNRTLTIVALWQGRALSKSKGSPLWAIRTSIARRLARTLLNRHVYTNTFKSCRCCGLFADRRACTLACDAQPQNGAPILVA